VITALNTQPGWAWLHSAFDDARLQPSRVAVRTNSLDLRNRLVGSAGFLGFMSRMSLRRRAKALGLVEIHVDEMKWRRRIGITHRRNAYLTSASSSSSCMLIEHKVLSCYAVIFPFSLRQPMSKDAFATVRLRRMAASIASPLNIAAFVTVAVHSVCVSNAWAQQKYPAQSVRIVVPYAPGGGADIMARVVAQKVSESLRASVVVENRSGAGGMIGSEYVVRAAPDGYTLAFVSSAYTTAAALHKFPYHPVDDVAAIILLGEASSFAVVHPSVPIRSVKELVSYAKAHPGKLNYGSGGTGGFSHLLVELFDLLAGTRMTHIPYKGTGPALNDLLGGQLEVIFGSAPSTAPYVKSGRLRALGVTSKVRSSALPGVPPIADTVPGYYGPLLYGMWGPKGLPADIAALWNKEVNRLLQTEDMKERLTNAGIDGVGGSPADFRDALRQDIERWQKVVKAANIKVSQ